eukprot:TRINITY_DN570_c0_g2_i1.p3 TRINITY_DN570_c0_g2~~TRINITY_DN570_c0_g2_i1.p3  ORF type:complete len:172 (-),score=48.59 TRINITY_DN570_c0_g2_i1:1415-1930(-)
MKSMMIIVLLALVGNSAAQSCAARRRSCNNRCGGADATDFKCNERRGAISSSCACASVSRSLGLGSVAPEEVAPAPVEEWCFDEEPRGGDSCEQHKIWNNCDQRWMKRGNYCRKTCFDCKCDDDVPPPQRFTCEQQKSFNKCRSPWMKENQYCEKTCGVCGVVDPAIAAAA